VSRRWAAVQTPRRAHFAIADIVLGVAGQERSGRLLVAVAIAVAVHGAIGLWAIGQYRAQGRVAVGPPRETILEFADTLSPPTLASPPAERESKREVRGATSRPRRPAPPPTANGAAGRAQAGAVVARAMDPDEVVDLTENSFVVGSARAYAGGATVSSGTSATGASAQDGDGQSPVEGHAATPPNQSRGVALGRDRWSCAWPKDADLRPIDEQTVVIYVVVAADGKPEAAEAVTDPGYGFASAAVSCALQTRFTPARDRTGKPVRARSPPIKVRFTR